VYLEWLSVFFQTGGFYQNRKTQDMSIDRAVSEPVIARYSCLCFVQAKRTHVSEGDTTRTTESRKIGLLREELREKFFNNNNNNNNNLLTASGLSPGGSGYSTFKLRQTY
jgi:hypothetical protein